MMSARLPWRRQAICQMKRRQAVCQMKRRSAALTFGVLASIWLWLIGMDLTSGENQSGSAANEKGDVRTDQGIPISSDPGSSDLSKANGRHLVYRPNQQQLGSPDLSICSSALAGHADLELGVLARPISPYGVNGQIRWQPRSSQLSRSNDTQSGGNLGNSQRDWRLVQLTPSECLPAEPTRRALQVRSRRREQRHTSAKRASKGSIGLVVSAPSGEKRLNGHLGRSRAMLL
ncbi:hypothetical protein Taro_000552 [Colocasia esculenta]|uniref:Uncharacterized protein n=1 Tax=Colocasia esculenta TaxID=4460 RepID=A0A843TGR8_COLES|nr:hypothetical protein [Colocasia esculenta]